MACSESPSPPRWQHLAAGFVPAPLAPLLARWQATEATFIYRSDEAGTGLWVEDTLPAPAWLPGQRAGEWRCARPAALDNQSVQDERMELVVDGLRLPLRAPSPRAEDCAWVAPGELCVFRPGSEQPPTDLRRALWFERGPAGGTLGRSAARLCVGEALAVWPGERVERRCDIPAASVLRFRARTHGFPSGGQVSYRVWLDDELVHEQHEDSASSAQSPGTSIALGPRERRGARLTFEVTGAPAATNFFAPLIAPAAVGSYGARPWDEPRADIMLFVADTFRADLLADFGGAAGLTPALDALAQRSVRFLEARSTSTWTLPAHASLFTGLWPSQHGAEQDQHTFGSSLVTLAELLAAAGYRTAAVTDSGYVSRAYGMDRGFEWFEEQRYDGEPRLARTLRSARALVAEDDGRPLFLFVHTYRTHWPYRAGLEEDARACHALRRKSLVELGPEPPADSPVLQAFAAEFHELYRSGARALDQAFGPWFAELEQAGLFARGLFVFTSDHGEEFLDSGSLLHGGEPHEALARVPLFVFGAGESARGETRPVSLIDLAPTLAARAGIAPEARWAGSDLFATGAERTLFASVIRKQERFLALWRGAHKLSATAREPLRLPEHLSAAYDLDLDPLARTNVLASAPWAAELARQAAPLWETIRQPLGEQSGVALDAAQAEELRQLGY